MNVMKTLRNFIILTGLLVSFSGFATTEEVVNEDNVTIVNEANTVAVSILNTNQASYQLYIYSEAGDLVFKSRLGSKTSLGKAFDFETAEKGSYTFKVVSNGVTKFEKEIVIN